MENLVSEQELRRIIKLIVQTGTCDQYGLGFTPEQWERIGQAFESYGRRDKSRPLRAEFSATRKPLKARRNRPTHELSECPKCGEGIWLVKTEHGPKWYEPGTDQKHVCYHDRFLGSAFEMNKRKH
jgi:hypothetical protein